MAFPYSLTREALQDLDDAVAWYAQQKKGLENRFLKQYVKLRTRICNKPEQFSVIYKNVHRARFSKTFKYAVYFLITGDSIQIIAIVHDKRNPKSWQERTI